LILDINYNTERVKEAARDMRQMTQEAREMKLEILAELEELQKEGIVMIDISQDEAASILLRHMIRPNNEVNE
jgi:mevalonate kinase